MMHTRLTAIAANVCAWRGLLTLLFASLSPVALAGTPTAFATNATVHVVAAGTLHGTTTWGAEGVHRITGVVRVGPGAVLRIAPGARVEGTAGSAIVVERTARLEAVGTMFEPIIFSCPADVPPTRDCWDGLVIAGNAPINGGTPDSPAARATVVAGCNQRQDDALAGSFGGCQPDDNSGVLRYVRIQYATRGLQLLGVGRGTQLEFVQVHGGGAGGLSIRGGTADLRHLLITSSGPTGIKWSIGWTGRLQHAIVQMPAEGGTAIEGSNDPAAPGILPRSAPELFNISAIRLPALAGAPGSTGLRLTHGTGVTVRNVLLAGFDVTLDIDGAESCGLLGSALSIQSGIVATTAAFGDPDADPDCVGGAALEDALLGDPSLVQLTDPVMIDGLLKAGFSAELPDFRSISPLFESAATLPPATGFYLPSQYVGAVPMATLDGANIPWHTGWTVGGASEAVNAFGAIAGVVSSATRGPLNGARVEAGDVSALTGADGAFTLTGVLAGNRLLALTTSPSGCTLPTAAAVVVGAGMTATSNIDVMCDPATITTSGMILTYICGNRFRVRNPNDALVPVTWDVAGAGESGALSLPARPLGSGFSEIFFETVATGTVRLFYEGSQIQVKANGGFNPTCSF
jgi:hypothetical protein